MRTVGGYIADHEASVERDAPRRRERAAQAAAREVSQQTLAADDPTGRSMGVNIEALEREIPGGWEIGLQQQRVDRYKGIMVGLGQKFVPIKKFNFLDIH